MPKYVAIARGIRKYGPYVYKGAKYLAKQRMKRSTGKYRGPAWKVRTRGQSDGRNGLADAVTAQGDRTVLALSKKRRNPKKRRFAKKVAYSINHIRPSRSYMITHSFVASVTNTSLAANYAVLNGTNVTKGVLGEQALNWVAIGTYNEDDTNKATNDLNNLYEVALSNTAADGLQKFNTPIHLKSFLFEIMMVNLSTNACYVDMYYWVAKKDTVYDINDLIAASDAQIATDWTGSTANYCRLATSNYGWTPYQSPNVMKHVTITKKERYFLPAGSCSQIEWRGSINKMWRKDQADSDGNLLSVNNKMKKGLSRGIFFISYGVPQSSGENTGNNVVTGVHTIRFSMNKTLFWNTVIGTSTDDADRSIQAVTA